ncbi:MAG: right-handed parallel beta-helix repeat-containing protein [Planctomycetota bacterium]|jgi:parallel beta-helix repeat protein
MKKKHFYTAVLLLSLLAIGIQPVLATIHVPTQTFIGDTQIATYDGITYTLIADVDEALFIQVSDLVVDGDGHTITGPGPGLTGVGVDINGKNGITVKNLTITGFQNGIRIMGSNLGPAEPKENVLVSNTITSIPGDGNSRGIRLSNTNATIISGNNISDSYWGIHLVSSGNTDIWDTPPYDPIYDYSNTITGNTVTGISPEISGGIWLEGSTYNTLELNTITDHSFAGIYLSVQSDNNTLTNNTSLRNGNGIFLNNSGGTDLLTGNKLTGNTTSNNEYGIKLVNSSYNTMTNNNVSNNTLFGIWLDPSNNNQINNNNFIDNEIQAEVISSTGNNFDGNYWSDWNPDLTTYYEFTGGKDNSPWSEPYGWIEHNTPLRIIPSIINREGCLERILAVIRFPEGITEEDIDIGQNLILYPGDSLVSVEATSQRIITWCRWGTSRVSVFAFFTKDDVTALIPEDGPAEMMVIGRFTDGQYFCGLDDVRIITWSW